MPSPGDDEDFGACREQLLSECTSTDSSTSPSRRALIEEQRKTSSSCLPPLAVAVVLFFLLIAFTLLAFFIFVGTNPSHGQPNAPENVYQTRLRQNVHKLLHTGTKLSAAVDPHEIRKNLHWLARRIHVAGTRENTQLMMGIADKYRVLGFSVRLYNYSVLLNYPYYEKPNTIEVQEEDGSWRRVSNGVGKVLGPPAAADEQTDPRALVWWSAYAANGSAEAEIVYCNYCAREDFGHLRKMGVSITGRIAMCRHGVTGRVDKVRLAEEYGAAAVILYSDPAEFTKANNEMFPKAVWLPESGAQRGSLLGTDGDPETPFFPSKNYVFRMENEQSLRRARVLPGIPVTPIGYGDAYEILQLFDGQPVNVRPHYQMKLRNRRHIGVAA